MGSSIHRASSFVEPGTPVIYGRECQKVWMHGVKGQHRDPSLDAQDDIRWTSSNGLIVHYVGINGNSLQTYAYIFSFALS